MAIFYIVFIGLGVIIGVFAGYVIRQKIAQKQANSIETKLKERIEKVKEEARQIILEAKDKADKILEDAKIEERNRKTQIDKLESRLL